MLAARLGSFDLLRSLELGDGPVDRGLVQVLWYVPIFLKWQKERFAPNGADTEAVEATMNEVISILEELLGVP